MRKRSSGIGLQPTPCSRVYIDVCVANIPNCRCSLHNASRVIHSAAKHFNRNASALKLASSPSHSFRKNVKTLPVIQCVNHPVHLRTKKRDSLEHNRSDPMFKGSIVWTRLSQSKLGDPRSRLILANILSLSVVTL